MAPRFVESLVGKNGRSLSLLGIGAHPDDCEFRISGTAAKLAARGYRITFLSMTNGQSGHFREGGAALVARRREEAREAAATIGGRSIVLPIADGSLDARLEYRFELIRRIREVDPDIIMTNRPNDYHPDHRYASQLVQDSAYMLRVPNVVPETPPMDHDPLILYWQDSFTKPLPFSPEIAVEIDSVFDAKLAMLDHHRSQVYEWLPWIEGESSDVPADREERLAWLAGFYDRRDLPRVSDRFRELLIARYGRSRGEGVKRAEAFELCEYGSRATKEQLEALFAGLEA